MTKKEMKKEMVGAYAGIKEALRQEKESIKYFNKNFYDVFTDWQVAVAFDEPDEQTKLQTIFETDLYNKNSCAYCVFLQLFRDRFPLD